jgi:type II secretory pathway component PulF
MNEFTLNLLAWLLILVALTVFAYAGYFLFSLPLRRRERARLFLDLLELGLRDGRSIEQTVHELGQTGDRALGARFHLLAAHLESGLSLDQALERVPRLLPPTIVGMLRAAREAGDLPRVLPACRQRLQDHVAAVWSAHHYLMLFALVVSPAWIATFTMLMVFVMPRFVAIAEDMEVGTMPGLLRWLATYSHALIGVQVMLAGGFYAAVLAYLGGPRLAAWLATLWPGLPDRIAWRLPWRRKRLQRDFSAVLAVVLDAGVPEARALALAGASTANAVMIERARAAVGDLEQGAGLAAAVRRLDDAGEFGWRLANAAYAPGRFRAALQGWQEALSAKAFQLEQTAAQLVTTALVLMNGLFVAALAAAVFGLLISIINGGLLW